MKLFVTGTTGFIGSHFAELAAGHGHEVVGSYRSRCVTKNGLIPRLGSLGVRLERVDVLSPERMQTLLRGTDCVCHFAGAFREGGEDDEYFQRVNVDGTRNVLIAAAAAGVRRFVFCSTGGIYGRRVEGAINERSAVNPWNAYERSKVDAEAEVRNLAVRLNLEYAIVRPCAVYGPRDQRLVKLFRAGANGRFPLFGRGDGQRHMIYVTDLARAFLNACELPDAASAEVIAAGPRAVPLRDMLDILACTVGRKKCGPSLPLQPMLLLAAVTEDACKRLGVSPPIHRRRMDFYLNDARFDCSKAADVLGWKPTVDLADGFAETYASYRAEGLI